MTLRIATRGSALARWQADHVARLLQSGAGPVDTELVIVETTGDRQANRPIAELGGQGVFVKEVQAALLAGRADLAVHSAKDLPSSTPPGLSIAAVPARADPRDALVGSTLDGLPPGGVVATGSVRRRAQIAGARPDLTFAPLRGNIESRLRRAAEHGAVVVALAALERLGRMDAVAEVLAPSLVLPQVGQGALAVECRSEDGEAVSSLAAVDHEPSHRRLDAERAFLAELGGGCDLPVGAMADLLPGGGLVLEGLLCTLDGRVVLRRRREAPGRDDPGELGRSVARELLDDCGGSALLDDLVGAARDGWVER